MIQITAVETKLVQLPVTQYVSNGLGNPSADPVSFAFMKTTAVPQAGDWKTGSWVQDTITGSWKAQCLVGPSGGAITLTIGIYYVWIKIVDPTELIEEPVDTLEVT